jgi:hypothetical protein
MLATVFVVQITNSLSGTTTTTTTTTTTNNNNNLTGTVVLAVYFTVTLNEVFLFFAQKNYTFCTN